MLKRWEAEMPHFIAPMSRLTLANASSHFFRHGSLLTDRLGCDSLQICSKNT